MFRDILLIVIGASVGSLSTYLAERLRRLYVYVDDWSMSATKPLKGVRRAEEAGDIEYYLTVKCFNRKSQAIGLHHIVFLFGTGRKAYIKNESVATRLVDTQGHSQYVAGSVTLEPHTWTILNCSATTKKEDRAQFANCTDAWLVADMENGRRYRVRLPRTTDLKKFA